MSRPSLRDGLAGVLRHLPVVRSVFDERDYLRAELRRLTVHAAHGGADVAELDPHRLETAVPVIRTLEERILLATRCRDADVLPKVRNAGQVVEGEGGARVQIMHNGIKVLAGGYYGAWMQELIARCGGHHEPQEERVFAAILGHLPPSATMIELGGFWSFYSIWFLMSGIGRRSVVVEADPAHLEIGRTNARINGCEPEFVAAFAGPEPLEPRPFQTESSGSVDLSCVSVAQLLALHGFDRLDLLHCDAQGIEFAILESCRDLFASGRIGWLVISTHTHHISGDPLTHQRCLALLRAAGATIAAEHDVQESFSGDGLIVAKFGALPEGWRPVTLSRNRYSESLFRNPLYDLAAANASGHSA